jgi:hypothetical protein
MVPLMSDKKEGAYSPPELIEYGDVDQLTEEGYGRGPPDDFPGSPEDPPGFGWPF